MRAPATAPPPASLLQLTTQRQIWHVTHPGCLEVRPRLHRPLARRSWGLPGMHHALHLRLQQTWRLALARPMSRTDMDAAAALLSQTAAAMPAAAQAPAAPAAGTLSACSWAQGARRGQLQGLEPWVVS